MNLGDSGKKSISIDLLGPLILSLSYCTCKLQIGWFRRRSELELRGRCEFVALIYFLSTNSMRVQCLLVLTADLLPWNAKVNSAVWKVCWYRKHFPRGTPSWFHLTPCSSSRAPALPHNRPWTHLWLQPHRFALEHLGVSGDVRSHRRAWVRLEEPLEGVCSYGAPRTSSFFVSVPQTITAQQRVGENPRFIVEPEFLFSQSRSFLLMYSARSLSHQHCARRWHCCAQSTHLHCNKSLRGVEKLQLGSPLGWQETNLPSYRTSRTVPFGYIMCRGVVFCCLTRSLCLKVQISLWAEWVYLNTENSFKWK